MAFGDFFRKKAEDDFSDFDKGFKGNDHLGLPPDGDITNTAPASQNLSSSLSPFGEEISAAQNASSGSPNSPTFARLHDFAKPAESVPSSSFQLDRSLDKDMQLINAKLDSIKSSLDSLSQRVANLERIAEGKQEPRW